MSGRLLTPRCQQMAGILAATLTQRSRSMTTSTSLVFFHNPHSRANMVRVLLEELGAEYELCPVDFQNNEQLSADYLAINPMGKVPTIRHNGTVVTETVAIYIYLADVYRKAG